MPSSSCRRRCAAVVVPSSCRRGVVVVPPSSCRRRAAVVSSSCRRRRAVVVPPWCRRRAAVVVPSSCRRGVVVVPPSSCRRRAAVVSSSCRRRCAAVVLCRCGAVVVVPSSFPSAPRPPQHECRGVVVALIVASSFPTPAGLSASAGCCGVVFANPRGALSECRLLWRRLSPPSRVLVVVASSLPSPPRPLQHECRFRTFRAAPSSSWSCRRLSTRPAASWSCAPS